MIMENIIIYDYIDKRINKFDFDSGINFLVSKTNTQGKSSLIKSIYYALGFSIKIWPDGWDANNMIFKLNIKHNNRLVSITRHRDLFYINDKEEILNEKEYSIWLQELLNIRIKIKEKKSKMLADVYASEVLLPFYIDQDKSWNGYVFSKTSDSFGRYTSTAKNLLDFYFGINNMKILDLEASKSQAESELKVIERKMESLELLEKNHLSTDTFVYISQFKNQDENKISEIQLNNYLKKLNSLNSIIALYDKELIDVEKEINILSRDLAELNKFKISYEKRFKEIEHKCIYCNSNLTEEQSLTRLKIRNNLYEISEQIDKCEKKYYELKGIRDKTITKKNNYISEQLEIEDIVNNSRNVDVKNYIENKVQQEIFNNYVSLGGNLQNAKNTVLGKIADIRKSITAENNLGTKKRGEIRKKYNELLNEYELSLGNVKLNDIKFNNFKEILGSGNDANKKMLAIYTLYSNLISEYSIVKIPFAMDSFIKNETAKDFKEKMFKFLSEFYLTIPSQVFFSIIEENLIYIDSKLSYNTIKIESPILKELNKDNVNLIESFGFIEY
ncbi:hypothetical protein ACFTQ7_04080 [Lysinibacillus sp. NPDC056959]|uniref:hypothetical protein n=1 Tax=Lysinibacillus sp. NPDC056959 TaxID=3345981 RepID=UPI003642234A